MPTHPTRSVFIAVAPLLPALAACLLGGCSLFPGRGESSLVVKSTADDASLAATFKTAAYLWTDNNTADIYLSDLPVEVLADPAADLRSRTGQLIHIHLFLVPIAGRTPIDPTACNFTIRHVVLAGGQAGMYSGGGFLLPSGEPGGDWFTASLMDATVRLARSDPGFTDRLGVSTLSGAIAAARNDAVARAMAGHLESIINSMPESARRR